MSHGEPKRARRRKRPIQPRNTYPACRGSPLLGATARTGSTSRTCSSKAEFHFPRSEAAVGPASARAIGTPGLTWPVIGIVAIRNRAIRITSGSEDRLVRRSRPRSLGCSLPRRSQTADASVSCRRGERWARSRLHRPRSTIRSAADLRVPVRRPPCRAEAVNPGATITRGENMKMGTSARSWTAALILCGALISSYARADEAKGARPEHLSGERAVCAYSIRGQVSERTELSCSSA